MKGKPRYSEQQVFIHCDYETQSKRENRTERLFRFRLQCLYEKAIGSQKLCMSVFIQHKKDFAVYEMSISISHHVALVYGVIVSLQNIAHTRE